MQLNIEMSQPANALGSSSPLKKSRFPSNVSIQSLGVILDVYSDLSCLNFGQVTAKHTYRLQKVHMHPPWAVHYNMRTGGLK